MSGHIFRYWLLIMPLVTIFISNDLNAKSFETNKRSNVITSYGSLYDKKTLIIRDEVTSFEQKISTPTSLTKSAAITQGSDIGLTYFDWQQNSSIGRMIDWGLTDPYVYFCYSSKPTLYDFSRVVYTRFDPYASVFNTVYPDLPENNDLFPNLDGIPNYPGPVIATQVKLDGDDFYQVGLFFITPSFTRNDYTGKYVDNEVLWPKVEHHIYGSDTVTYILACSPIANDDYTLLLYKKVGLPESPPPTVQYLLSTDTYPGHDITASRISPKVAVCWLDKSGENIPENNDVWYWPSYDMGATWDPADKVNVTEYQPGTAGYRAWLELSCLYDQYDQLHIIWNGNIYNGYGLATSRSCRLFHYTDFTENITDIHRAEWDPVQVCGTGGYNVMNIGNITISECNSRLYVIWNQWGDPAIGDTTDCADLEYVNISEAANADIYLSVSVDLIGESWDRARNLTQSKTPGCDTTSFDPCDNEIKPSMSRYGMNIDDYIDDYWPPEALTIDPDPSGYTGTHYLDVMYVNDEMPGISGAVYPEGGLNTFNYIKWFRLPCVDPIIAPQINVTPAELVYPEYIQHGQEKAYVFTIENTGTSLLEISEMTDTKYSQTGIEWLDYASYDFPVPTTSVKFWNLIINPSGIINDPGTVVSLKADINFLSNDPINPTYVVPIDVVVADTLMNIIWDTLSSYFIYGKSLVVSNHGNMGNNSAGKVNLDFYETTFECDNQEPDNIPGNAEVYLADASPFILTADIVGADTNVTASWSIFENGLDHENSFKPVYDPDHLPEYYVGFQGKHFYFYTGKFTTIDSTICVEIIHIIAYNLNSEDIGFFQFMKLYSYDGLAHAGMTIGHVYDWDIPSDSNVDNTSEIRVPYPSYSSLIIKGAEWNDPEGDALECLNNDERAGTVLNMGTYYTKGTYKYSVSNAPYNVFAESNEDFVYPNRTFDPLELYRNVHDHVGYETYQGSDTVDLHMIMTHVLDYDLPAAETLFVHTVTVTYHPDQLSKSTNNIDDVISSAIDYFETYKNEFRTDFKGPRCGDLNADTYIMNDDIILLSEYLTGQQTLEYMNQADVDRLPGINNNDLMAMMNHKYVTFEAICDACPYPIDTVPPTTVDSLIFNNLDVPAGESQWAIEVWDKTVRSVQGISIPFSFSCSNADVTLDSIKNGSRYDAISDYIDNDNNKGLILKNSLSFAGIGEGTVATIYFTLDNTAEDRTILIDTCTYPPSHTLIYSYVLNNPVFWGDITAGFRPTLGGSCCTGQVGDVNCNGGDDPDISDITRLIDYLYLSHDSLCCPEEADANVSGGEPDISDITRLIDYLYISHEPLADCP